MWYLYQKTPILAQIFSCATLLIKVDEPLPIGDTTRPRLDPQSVIQPPKVVAVLPGVDPQSANPPFDMNLPTISQQLSITARDAKTTLHLPLACTITLTRVRKSSK